MAWKNRSTRPESQYTCAAEVLFRNATTKSIAGDSRRTLAADLAKTAGAPPTPPPAGDILALVPNVRTLTCAVRKTLCFLFEIRFDDRSNARLIFTFPR